MRGRYRGKLDMPVIWAKEPGWGDGQKTIAESHSKHALQTRQLWCSAQSERTRFAAKAEYDTPPGCDHANRP